MLRRLLGMIDEVRRYNRGELGYGCLFVNITSRCNSRCRYCEAYKLDAARELDQARLFSLFEEARQAGVPHIYLSGGEPFFRRDVWELIEKILSLGLRFSVVSNGLLVENFLPAQLDLLKNAQWIDISLESGRPETHDFLRGGKGFLKRTTGGIRILKSIGLKVNINTTVCRQNYAELPGVIAFAKEHAVDYINFQPLHVWNNYHDVEADDKSDMLPTPEQVAHLPEHFRELARLARKFGVRTNIPHVAPWMRQYFEHCLDESSLWMRRCLKDFSCLEIAAKLFVDADGSVLPCALLPPAGNVQEEPLSALVEKMRPVREAIRDGQFPPACNRCSCQMSINYKFSVLRRPVRNFGRLTRYAASLVGEKLSRLG
ncbi:MAG: radical SAM protein [Desulfovibrionaceae bacterium]|nr:radical SAM protein [Desulfovibrionaceae bacterium]